MQIPVPILFDTFCLSRRINLKNSCRNLAFSHQTYHMNMELGEQFILSQIDLKLNYGRLSKLLYFIDFCKIPNKFLNANINPLKNGKNVYFCDFD
jgi:hypothetical protein